MIKKYLLAIYTFYTFWAIILHLGYAVGLLPNTFPVALFILILSQIFLFIYPNYIQKYGLTKRRLFTEIVFHWLPFLLIPRVFSVGGFVILGSSVGLYVLLHGKKLISYYQDPLAVWKRIGLWGR